MLYFCSATIDASGLIEHEIKPLVPFNGTVLNGQQINGTSINGTANSHSSSSGRSTPNNGGDPAPGKLFVGGLSWQTSSEKLREYFGMFGNVTDVLIMKDPVTQVSFFNLLLSFDFSILTKKNCCLPFFLSTFREVAVLVLSHFQSQTVLRMY